MTGPPSGRASAWSMITRAFPAGMGGGPTRGGEAQEEEGRQARAKGAPDAPGDADLPEQQVGGGGIGVPPPSHTTIGLCPRRKGGGLLHGGRRVPVGILP